MNKSALDGVKAFIFDLDGTLIDTEKIYRQVWPKATADLGYELVEAFVNIERQIGEVRFDDVNG